MVSYTASRGFNKTRDDKYEKGYYWWSAHTRLAAFVGGRLAYRLATPRARYAALYYELGTKRLVYYQHLAQRRPTAARQHSHAGRGREDRPAVSRGPATSSLSGVLDNCFDG